MSGRLIPYLKIEETPGWSHSAVIDDEGTLYIDVVEASAVDGWLIRRVRDDTGVVLDANGDAALEVIHAAITIEVYD